MSGSSTYSIITKIIVAWHDHIPNSLLLSSLSEYTKPSFIHINGHHLTCATSQNTKISSLQFLHRITHLSYLYQTTSSQLLNLCHIKVVMFGSFFKMLHIPWPLSRDARLRAFPPGAAQQSIMISPGCASTTATTSPAWQEILHI